MHPALRDTLVGPLPILGRTALAGVLAAVSLLPVVRHSGQRTLSQRNPALDLVVGAGRGPLRWDDDSRIASCV
jgi:hypothetical protein